MSNFEEWYKETYPDFYPELDDMYEQLKDVYYAGYLQCLEDGKQ